MNPAVLITGAAQRIGRAMALHMATHGYDVVIHYHQSKDNALTLQNEIQQLGRNAIVIAGDLQNKTFLSTLVAVAQQQCPGLSVLVNNASVFKNDSYLSFDAENYLEEHMNLHFYAPFELTKQWAQHVASGHVVNMIDRRMVHNETHYFTYSLSKKALANLTEMSAMALAPKIRVNAIAPGYILPPQTGGTNTRQMQDIPLQRHGSVKHICQALEYLCQNDYVTGQILHVDGGEHVRKR